MHSALHAYLCIASKRWCDRTPYFPHTNALAHHDTLRHARCTIAIIVSLCTKTTPSFFAVRRVGNQQATIQQGRQIELHIFIDLRGSNHQREQFRRNRHFRREPVILFLDKKEQYFFFH